MTTGGDAQLGASLDLTTDAALENVQSFGAQIEEVLAAAGASLSTALADALASVSDLAPTVDVGVDADTAAAAESIGALGDVDPVDVPVDADTAAAADAISGLDDNVEPIEVPVDADTSGAEEKLDSLGEAASGAASGVSQLSDSAGGLTVAGGLAAGSADNMLGGITGIAEKAGPAGLGIAAVTGAAAVFAGEATEALGATQRFNAVMGEMADRVENLKDINGLNTNLGDLALQLGSDDDKIRVVAARMFELATASGKSEDQASVFTEQLVSMGARAVALNPTLGDMGDVTDALSTALVRGGRFASKFGLDLNQADINSRALNDTHKTSVSELSYVEKAMAGTALATEKYGGDLENVIARGSENAITQQKRLRQTLVENIEALGKPLVAPMFEVLEAAIPAITEVGQVLANLAIAVLPALTTSLHAVTPLLQLLGDGVGAVTDVTDELGVTTIATGALIGAKFGVQGAAVGAALGGLAELIEGMGGLADAEKDVQTNTTRLVDDLNKTSSLAKVFHEFEGVATLRALAEGTSVASARLKEFREIAETDAGSARILLSAMEEAGIKTGPFAKILEDVTDHTARHAKAADDQREAVDAAADSADRAKQPFTDLGVQVDTAAAGFDAAAAKFGLWGAAAALNVGVTDEALGTMASSVDEFASSLESSIDSFTNPFTHNFSEKIPEAIVVSKGAMADFLRTSNETAQTFLTVTNDLIARGVDEGIIQNIARAGPEALPQMQAFVQVVDEQGVDAVNAMFGNTSAMAQQTEQQFQAMVLSTSIHMAEQNLIVQAVTADMRDGGTEHLSALAANSDVNLANMATQALIHLGEIRAGVDGLPTEHPIVIEVSYQIQPLADAFNAAGIPVTQENLNAFALSLSPHAAEGMIVYPTPGGTQVTVAEAGFPEVILPTDDPARAWDLLVQSGLAAQLGPEFDKLFKYLGGVAAANVAAYDPDMTFAPTGTGTTADPFAPPYATSGDINSIQAIDALKGIISQSGLTMLGAGDTSEPHWFEDNTGITDDAYRALWGQAWAYYAKGGFTDWPESEGRLAMLHGQETILNRRQMSDLMGGLGEALPRYGGDGRDFARQVVNHVTVDQHSDIAVDARGQPDAARIGIAMSRRWRADVHAMRRVELPT